MTRTLWLLYALIAVSLICMPVLFAKAQTAQLVHCQDGICVIPEFALDILTRLAEKAGKSCT